MVLPAIKGRGYLRGGIEMMMTMKEKLEVLAEALHLEICLIHCNCRKWKTKLKTIDGSRELAKLLYGKTEHFSDMGSCPFCCNKSIWREQVIPECKDRINSPDVKIYGMGSTTDGRSGGYSSG